MKKQFRSFENARKFAQSLKLKSNPEWIEYCHSGKKPDDIPYKPQDRYKNKGWINWGDFLGTGIIATFLIEFRPFEDAREFVRKLNLGSLQEWKKYSKSGKKPDDIPSNPNATYENKGWKGMGDWLGTNRIAPQLMQYRGFEDARSFVRKRDLKTRTDWDEYCKSGKKPEDIPSNPVEVYKNKGWKGVGDWLGTGKIANQTISKNYLPFKESREMVRELAKKYHIRTWSDWEKAVKEGKIPKNIPLQPDRVYSKKRKK